MEDLSLRETHAEEHDAGGKDGTEAEEGTPDYGEVFLAVGFGEEFEEGEGDEAGDYEALCWGQVICGVQGNRGINLRR